MEWYEIANIESLDTPAFVVFPERIEANINKAISMCGSVNRLRPHVKTTKTPEVIRMMLDKGISSFKCATIAEAEMLGRLGCKDVLLAYQPVGPKIERIRLLCHQFPDTSFAVLADNIKTARDLDSIGADLPAGHLDVYVDVNVGQNRTGIETSMVSELFASMRQLNGIRVAGLHIYDGHIRDTDYDLRQKRCDMAFADVERMRALIDPERVLDIVIGGSPSFSVHCKRKDVVCSPGTFVYWDFGYARNLPEQEFLWAALVVCRVISRINDRLVCVDLGHKAIASENPFPRVHFLNLPEAVQVGHSEEHLVLDMGDSDLEVGDVLYGVPHHVCPTCNLYERAHVALDNKISGSWLILARDRMLSI